MSNHAHLLLRTGGQAIASVMRRLLTGYAVSFNRQHRRHGHLFQNRYKSILCDEEVYFKELIRYVHLNPLRAGLVDNLAGLDRYPWCGHAFVVNGNEYPWHDVSFVLSRFGEKIRDARQRYREFLDGGIRENLGCAKGKWRSDWSLLEWLKEIRRADDLDEPDRDARVLG